MLTNFIRYLLNITLLSFIALTLFWGTAQAMNNESEVNAMNTSINEMKEKKVSLSNKPISGRDENDLNNPNNSDNVWIKAKYQLVSEEEVIGELSSERKASITAQGFEIMITGTMQISIKNFWEEYNFFSDEEVVIDESGLNRYQGVFKEDTNNSSVNIDLNNTEVRIHGFGEDDKPFEYKLEREEFDAVSEDAPWVFIKSGAKEKSLKVLDLDNFEITEVMYHYQKKDHVDIKGEVFDCHQITFNTPVKQGEQCIVIDKTGAWIAHESGKDENGEYSVTLTELTHSKNR